MNPSLVLFWVAVAVAVAGTGVAWLGSERLERSAEILSDHYGLPMAVRGAVVLAIGSSFPEFSTAVLSTLIHGEFDLGVGAIVGSAVVNILTIPALAALIGGQGEVEVNRDIVYKEAQFYMVAVSALIIVFALAVIYRPVEDGGAAGGGDAAARGGAAGAVRRVRLYAAPGRVGERRGAG